MRRRVTWAVVSIMIGLASFSCGDNNSTSSGVAADSDSPKAIILFGIKNTGTMGVIDEEAKTVSVAVPPGTNVKGLVATFAITGEKVKVGSAVQTNGKTPNDFTNPVPYVVVAADDSTVTYMVTVTTAASSEKTITAFSFANPPATATIDEAAKTISATVPDGTNIKALIATFSATGVSVKVGGVQQTSGTTANDFTNAVIYTVTAADNSTASYSVKVNVANYNYINLQSDANDYIGGGHTYSYTQADAVIKVTATGGLLSLTVEGDQNWTGDFQVPNTFTQLQPGTYNNVTRYPFNDPATGGLSWSGEGRGCNTLTGSFVINQATYTSGVLTAIDLNFEQHCEGGVPALYGQIHWKSTDTTAPAGPVNPPPSGLWQPASGATPATGNYIYLQSDANDYIGAGQTYTYTPTDATITLTPKGGLLTVNVAGTKTWSGDFQAMNILTQLQAGYYGSLLRYPFHNPTRGGLDWSGDGRGCNELTGWFVVDNVTYSGGSITAIDLRFEQHCEGATPALHGKIHWVQ